MTRLSGRTLWMALAIAFAGGSVGASPALAQELGAGDRITIMVPDLAPAEGTSDRFGKRVANELREMIAELHTHQTVSGRDIRDARREYDLSHRQLFNCISARQLAMRMEWGLVLCAEYEAIGDRQVRVNARFVGSEDGNEFEVPEFTVSERDTKQAAQTILETFDEWQTQLRHTVFCQQYMDSERWDDALRNCEQALEINPTSGSALYKKAFILRETERYDEALETLEELLELDAIDQDALKLAGIVATQAGMPERAREYFDRYMELNPGDVGVRLTIATDISNAGDPATAMEFAQEGLEVEPDDTRLLTYIGHFAVQAAGQAESALNAQNQGQEPTGTADPTKVGEYYQTAAESYQRVFEEEGDETDPEIVERLIVSLFKLQNYDEAIALGQQAVEMAPENASVWDAYSRALQEAGQTDEALAAIEKVREFGGSSPGLIQREALLRMQAGDAGRAIEALNEGVEEGLFEATVAFNIVFGHAYRDNFQKGRLDAAYELLEAAGPLAVEEKDRLTRNFWRGYIMKEQALAALGEQEEWNAEKAERAKPMFERALELLRTARGYEQYHGSANVPGQIEQVDQYIQITDSLIRRGR